MTVTRDEVFRMARLARLALDEEEADGLLEDLNGILDHMESLAEVRAEPVEDTGEAHREGPVRLREGRDEEPDRLVRGPADGAPAWEDGFFLVPRLPAVEGEDAMEGEDAAEGEDVPERGGEPEDREP